MTPQENYSEEMINRLCQGLQVPQGKGKDAVWTEILQNLKSNTQAPMVPLWVRVSRVAAVFLGLMLIGSMFYVIILGKVEYYSPAGKHLVVMLPDSSSVHLNADSHLEYNRVLWGLTRNVKLDGEALFKVNKGDKFSVKTGPVVTQVLGTTFNVFARNNSIKVSCIEGMVGVRHTKTKESFTLKPLEKVISENSGLVTTKNLDKTEMAPWVQGEFYFNNTPIGKVFAELQRQFNVKVKLEVPTSRLYTGVFFNNDLYEALDLICIPMQLRWAKQNGTIIITNK